MRYAWILSAYMASVTVVIVSCGDTGNNNATGSGGRASTSSSNGNGSGSGGSGGGIDPSYHPPPPTSTGAGCSGAMTCTQAGANCGPIGDGCGGVIPSCGTCPAGQTCGGGGPSMCGISGGDSGSCVPKTCAELNANCGPVGDGCGGLLQCGTCSLPETCGGAGASVCGIDPSCTNLCLQQVQCPGNATTTVSGTVYAPGHVGDPPPPQPGSADPLVNALVYVPNAAVQPFTPGVACEQCGAQASGSPLVSAVTGPDGKFVLKNVPVGANIPLVIQIGRWRRQVTISDVPACQDTALPASLTRLPRNKNEGDIPLMAFSTGAVDALECVLRKIGVDDSEFTLPSGNGRIQIYKGTGAAGADLGANTPTEAQLWGNLATLKKYDMVLFPCQGKQFDKQSPEQKRVVDYASAGGRVFTTHYSYVWLYNIAPFSGTANWKVDQAHITDQNGIIDTSFPKGQALADWLNYVGASSTYAQIPIKVLRHDADGVIAPSQSWMTTTTPQATMHYTFNTPVGTPPDQQCGRVLFDDFHVEDISNNQSTGVKFPGECDNNPMTPQEKLLEFMIFDLGSCIAPDKPTCTPKTCADLGIQCGPAGDGCGGAIQCGTCPTGQTCGGGGIPSVCGAGVPSCTPRTCAQAGADCGPVADGCGGLLQCGTCAPPQTCGGGGKANVCGGTVPK